MKLFYKGLIFVSVLLVCELTLLGGLYALELRSESEARQANESRAIVAEGTNLIRILQAAVQSLSSYAFLRNPEALVHFESLRTTELPLCLKHLRQVSKGYSQQDLKQLERIALDTNSMMSILEQSREVMGHDHKLGEMVKIHELLDQSFKVRADLDTEMLDFVNRHRLMTTDQIDPESESKSIIKNILIIGVGFNIVLAMSMALLFSRSITSRLEIMSENTRRVMKSLPLQARLTGNDEIANLDKTFHDMSRALTEAAQREREIERLRREFVDMVSHDLRTPISSIHACLHLLGQGYFGQLAETGTHTVAVAEGEATRVMRLISDLLDVARIDSGTMEICASRWRVGHLFAVCATAVESQLEDKRIELQVDESDLLIEADQDRLVQVLVNLLSNAIKFSPVEGKIHMGVEKVDDQAEISVTDEGPGIAKEMQNAVFERFKQVSKDDRKNGTGLGLAICKMIVEAHGGTIGVRSEVGKGCTFWFHAPLAVLVPAAENVEVEA